MFVVFTAFLNIFISFVMITRTRKAIFRALNVCLLILYSFSSKYEPLTRDYVVKTRFHETMRSFCLQKSLSEKAGTRRDSVHFTYDNILISGRRDGNRKSLGVNWKTQLILMMANIAESSVVNLNLT